MFSLSCGVRRLCAEEWSATDQPHAAFTCSDVGKSCKAVGFIGGSTDDTDATPVDASSAGGLGSHEGGGGGGGSRTALTPRQQPQRPPQLPCARPVVARTFNSLHSLRRAAAAAFGDAHALRLFAPKVCAIHHCCLCVLGRLRVRLFVGLLVCRLHTHTHTYTPARTRTHKPRRGVHASGC